jgi:hypothetical protein
MLRAVGAIASTMCLLAVGATHVPGAHPPQTARRSLPSIDSAAFTAADFFDPQRVWTVELTLGAEDWAAMQPRTSSRPRNYTERFQGSDGGRNGLAAAQGIEFTYVHADLAIDGRRFGNVGLRYKGNGTFRNASRGNGKYPLKIDLNKYVKGQKLAGLTTLNLQNNITDASWMNEVLAYRLYRDAGVPAPRSSYARVYMTVPGAPRREYWGLYSISENIDTNFSLDRFGTRRGAILKPSTSRVFADLGDDWALYTQTYDPKTDLTPDEQRRVIDFCRFVTTAGDAEFAARLGEHVDLEAFARYAAVLVWLANTDSLLANGQNYYVYLHPQTHRLSFVPWDQDGSFGNFGRFRGLRSESLDVSAPWQGTNRFLKRVFGVEAFRTLYLTKLDEFSRTLFTPDRFAAQMAEIAPAIREAIAEESASKLSAFDAAVAGSTGIVPFTRARAANVTRQLAER